MTIIKQLKEHFDPNIIKWRVGATNQAKDSGIALCYIDSRHVMDRLDEVVGPENWQTRHHMRDGKTICELGINIMRSGDAPQWVWKSDGAGDTKIEADKGAISDSLKRAAVQWGIGRYLYNMPNIWVDLYNKKIKKDQYTKLMEALQNIGKAERYIDIYVEMQGGLDACESLDELKVFWENHTEAITTCGKRNELEEQKNLLKHSLMDRESQRAASG